LELHPKQKKQVNPQDTHEMPVARSGVQSTSFEHRLVQFSDDANQATEPPEHVESVGYGQHVEERVADVRGQSESLGFELHPGKSLPCNKEQTKGKGDVQPLRRAGCLVPGPAHEFCN